VKFWRKWTKIEKTRQNTSKTYRNFDKIHKKNRKIEQKSHFALKTYTFLLKNYKLLKIHTRFFHRNSSWAQFFPTAGSWGACPSCHLPKLVIANNNSKAAPVIRALHWPLRRQRWSDHLPTLPIIRPASLCPAKTSPDQVGFYFTTLLAFLFPGF
jgi:hypothetical protein